MNNFVKLLQNFTNESNNNLNIMMIGKIQNYNSVDNTASIEPLHYIPGQNMPYNLLTSVPIGFFSIGGYSIKVAPKKGDLVLLLYCDYDIDNLMLDGTTKRQNTDRTHALEDAIALPLSINFLNNAFNATEDLVISKEGTSTYIKMQSNGDIVLNAGTGKIKLGENATKGVLLDNGEGNTVSTKILGE